MLIAIDHGNYAVKTPHFSFISGLTACSKTEAACPGKGFRGMPFLLKTAGNTGIRGYRCVFPLPLPSTGKGHRDFAQFAD